jgi:hypothetical protein
MASGRAPLPAALCDFDGRLNRIEEALDRLMAAERIRQAGFQPESPPIAYVTHDELKDLLGRAEKRLEGHVAEQFGNQMLAIGSLRDMIVDTDTLLERVLSRLEASALDADNQTEALESLVGAGKRSD